MLSNIPNIPSNQPPTKKFLFCLTLTQSVRKQFCQLHFPYPWLSMPLWNHSGWGLEYPLDLLWHPDVESASPSSCALRSCPITTLRYLPWKGSMLCTTPGGTIITCGMCSISHFPESRHEANRLSAQQQAFSGHLLWGGQEDERPAWSRAQGPLYVGCLSYHRGACFEAH